MKMPASIDLQAGITKLKNVRNYFTACTHTIGTCA
jgi:hypothetical protein